MARPAKKGLDYFPKDTGFYRDRKIRALIGRFGSDGAILYDYILCEVYGDMGYYTEADDSFLDIAAADLRMSPERIGLILDYLLNKSRLLDGALFRKAGALTSHGIQTRYQAAVRERAKKRGIRADGELWLLDEDETEGFVQVNRGDSLSGKNPGKFPEESIKKRRAEESREDKSREETGVTGSGEPEDASPPMMCLPLNDGTVYAVSPEQIRAWEALYPAVDVAQQLRNMRGWLDSNPARRKTGRGIGRFINGWLAKEQDRGGSGGRNGRQAGDGRGAWAYVSDE